MSGIRFVRYQQPLSYYWSTMFLIVCFWEETRG